MPRSASLTFRSPATLGDRCRASVKSETRGVAFEDDSEGVRPSIARVPEEQAEKESDGHQEVESREHSDAHKKGRCDNDPARGAIDPHRLICRNSGGLSLHGRRNPAEACVRVGTSAEDRIRASGARSRTLSSTELCHRPMPRTAPPRHPSAAGPSRCPSLGEVPTATDSSRQRRTTRSVPRLIGTKPGRIQAPGRAPAAPVSPK